MILLLNVGFHWCNIIGPSKCWWTVPQCCCLLWYSPVCIGEYQFLTLCPLLGWEQRVSQTPKTDSTPARGVLQTPSKFTAAANDVRTAPQTRDSAPVPEPPELTSKPVSDIRASWKEKDIKNNPVRENEPTAFSVTDRMSAWEAMSSSNKVRQLCSWWVCLEMTNCNRWSTLPDFVHVNNNFFPALC